MLLGPGTAIRLPAAPRGRRCRRPRSVFAPCPLGGSIGRTGCGGQGRVGIARVPGGSRPRRGQRHASAPTVQITAPRPPSGPGPADATPQCGEEEIPRVKPVEGFASGNGRLWVYLRIRAAMKAMKARKPSGTPTGNGAGTTWSSDPSWKWKGKVAAVFQAGSGKLS